MPTASTSTGRATRAAAGVTAAAPPRPARPRKARTSMAASGAASTSTASTASTSTGWTATAAVAALRSRADLQVRAAIVHPFTAPASADAHRVASSIGRAVALVVGMILAAVALVYVWIGRGLWLLARLALDVAARPVEAAPVEGEGDQ